MVPMSLQDIKSCWCWCMSTASVSIEVAAVTEQPRPNACRQIGARLTSKLIWIPHPWSALR